MQISSEQNDPQQILLKGFVSLFQTCCACLYERYNVCESSSCLKMMIQAHLHVGFFTVFFIKLASLKRFYLYMKLAIKHKF